MDRPFVVCHMLSSLDGKIDGEFFSAPECRPALAEYGNLRGFYGCQATLYGTTTMIGSYADGMVGELPDISDRKVVNGNQWRCISGLSLPTVLHRPYPLWHPQFCVA